MGHGGKQIAAADVMSAPLPMAFGNGLGRPPCRSGSAADAIRQGDHDKVTQGLPMVYHHLDLGGYGYRTRRPVALTAWHRQANRSCGIDAGISGRRPAVETIVAIHADDAVDLQVAFIPGSGRLPVPRPCQVSPGRVCRANADRGDKRALQRTRPFWNPPPRDGDAKVATSCEGGTGMRVLIVEDDTNTADFIVKGLRQAGYTRTSRATARTACFWRSSSPMTPSCSIACCRAWMGSRCCEPCAAPATTRRCCC